MTHRLKIWPSDLELIRLGRKRSEVRRVDDRKFKVGDVLELVAFDPSSGRELDGQGFDVVVTHIERMAGPLTLEGRDRLAGVAGVPMAVLSFEVRT